MQRTDVIVIGGGQAGLAASQVLSQRGIDHLVLERGRVGERWHSERWASLRLLTPNWQTRLPGFRYAGGDPDGYMRASELAGFLQSYARSFSAPLVLGTRVLSVTRKGTAYVVDTDRGRFLALAVIIASGECALPRVPAWSHGLPATLYQSCAAHYRHPAQLPDGGVLVVGASASGVQLADEIQRSGRPVTLAVGRHVPLPRRYRGRDIMAWLDWSGILDERPAVAAAGDPARDHGPSLQLVGRPAPVRLDLPFLASQGVRIAGRLQRIAGGKAYFEGDLAQTTAQALARQTRLLGRIDACIAELGLRCEAPDAPAAQPDVSQAPRELDLAREGIRSVVWATGYRPDYSWLNLPVVGATGAIRQRQGVTEMPGLYVLGLRFLRHRNSNFIDGVGRDAVAVVDGLHQELNRRIRRVAA